MVQFKILRTLLLTAIIFASSQSATFAEVDNTIALEVFNKTGQTWQALYFAPHDTDGWGQNWLEEPLRSGDSAFARYGSEPRYYKLKIVFANGKSVTWQKNYKFDAYSCKISLVVAKNKKGNYIIASD